MEVTLPPSGLAKANYPDVFPSPPTTSPVFPNNAGSDAIAAAHRSSSFVHSLDVDTELIWCYYISEIAVRKIGNRIMNSFYKHNETKWLSMPLDRMFRVADELELQLTQWFANLPTTLANTSVETPHNRLVRDELQFMLHPRLCDFRARIYRPFLYLCMHYPAEDPVQGTLAPYVHRCVEACLTALFRGTPRHRHHGTWYENRGMFLQSLLVIAAVKSRKVEVDEIWRKGVDSCIAGFKFWEHEAPDLREARYVLESLLAGLYRV